MTKMSNIDIPKSLESERLIIRMPTVDDAAEVCEAIAESQKELIHWMSWADELPTLAEQEERFENVMARFERAEDLWLFLFAKDTGKFIGGSGLHNVDWSVPKFAIGYWIRTSCAGRGYMTEAVKAITDFAFSTLNAKRVEIRMDTRNARSVRVAERADFTLEGILHNERRAMDGSLRDTKVYAKTIL